MKVVKFGGSLINHARDVINVFSEYEVIIVPGGGLFSDTIRVAQQRYDLSERAAHYMAILSMHQYGEMLSDISGIPLIDSINNIGETAILQPLEIIKRSKLEPSWSVASDTIACYIAHKLFEKEFLKITDISGLIHKGQVVSDINAGKLLNTTTCLDKSLPLYLQKWNIDCRIINGKSKTNIKNALDGEPIGSLVRGGK